MSSFAGFVSPLIETHIRNNPVYRVRVTVVDPTNRPVKGAQIISVPSGEQKVTEGGSEIVIPDSVLSQDRKLGFAFGQRRMTAFQQATQN